MNKVLRKAVSFVLAIAMISSIGCVAFANAEMENMVFVGYDTTSGHYSSPAAVTVAPNKIYNEVYGGVQTGKQILIPVEKEDITYQPEGYEGVYPYAGYSRMYLEGNAQPITVYNSLFPQWEERRQDYMWELQDPHYIYERQQTKVNNTTWQWNFGNKSFGIPDSDLLTKTAKKAVIVDKGYKYYGFGPYDTECNVLDMEEVHMYKSFLVPTGIPGVSKTVYDAAVKQWEDITGKASGVLPDNPNSTAFLSVRNLSARNWELGTYVVTDEMIRDAIPVVYTKYVTAKFNDVNDEGLETKTVADEYLKYIIAKFADKNYGMNQSASDEYLANIAAGWDWDVHNSFAVMNHANIGWTEPTFEAADHHAMYQYLIINNIVMDGTNGKERIVRYTDGYALPNEEWRFVFYEHELDAAGNEIPYLYKAVEQQYLNGVAVLDNDGDYVYRNPVIYAGENQYFVKNGDAIETWKVDADGKESRISKIDNWVGSLGGEFEAAFANGSYELEHVVPSEVNKMIP